MASEDTLDADATLSEYLKYHGDQLMSARSGKLELDHDTLDQMIQCIAVSAMLAENLETQQEKLHELLKNVETCTAANRGGVLQ